MNSMEAFSRNRAAQGQPQMVFDWVKAAEIIRTKKPDVVSAGLRYDWEYTGGVIYSAGEPVLDSYTYLSSNWAVPEIDVDGEVSPCYVLESDTRWDEHTKWPPEALAVLQKTIEEEK